MEKDKSIKSKIRISRREFAFITLIAFMVIFNFLVFNLYDFLLSNPGEFGIQTSEIIWAFTWRTILIFLFLWLVFCVLCHFTKKGFKYTMAVTIGLVFTGYFQLLFLNDPNNMGLIGTPAAASVLDWIINSLIWIFMVSIPVVIVFREERMKNRKEKPLEKSFTVKLAIGLSIILMGMQLTGVVSAAANETQVRAGDELYYFSVDKQLELSKNKNVVVFVLDTMDDTYVEKIFDKYVGYNTSNNGVQEYKTYREIFDGFTRYTNNVSGYQSTFPAVVSLLTGKELTKSDKDQVKYRQDAWNEEQLFTTLYKNNWVANALPCSSATFYSFDDLYFADGKPKISNISKMEKENRIINENKYFLSVAAAAVRRQAGYILKVASVYPGKATRDAINECVDIKDVPDYFPNKNSGVSDLLFYQKLTEEGGGVKVTHDQNVFSYVHLLAGHMTQAYNENLKLTHNTNPQKQLAGAFKIVDEYLQQMKDQNIFDDATIIIMADHGHRDFYENSDKMKILPSPSLFIKEGGVSADSAFKVDDESEVSNNNFIATVMQEIVAADNSATIPELPQHLKYSYYDVINDGGLPYTAGEPRQKGKQLRYFHYVRWVNLASHTYERTYQIRGHNRDIKNWHLL